MSYVSEVMVIGLTGQSGAGKTTVCDVFREKGFEVINADKIAHEVVTHIDGQENACLNELIKKFSTDIILKDGNLNRPKLAEIVFNDKSKLEMLGSITYPFITERILAEIERFSHLSKNLVILDAPTLFESKASDFCEVIISVIAGENVRVERIISRDGITREQALSRVNSQPKDEFYEEYSDFVIINNKCVEVLKDKAREVSDKIKEYYEAKKAT